MYINIWDWKFWLILIILIVLIRWLFVRSNSNQHEFVGLKPLYPSAQRDNVQVPVNVPEEFSDPDKVVVVNSWIPHTINSDMKAQVNPVVSLSSSFPSSPVGLSSSPSSSPSSSSSDSPVSELEDSPVKKKHKKYTPNLMANGKSSIGEHLTCEAFKALINDPDKYTVIRNSRPKFLTNPKTGYPLEIDCFCPELGCGVEYNGIQHYQFPNPFNTSEQEFEAQVERDLIKRQLADKNGTPIFTVPCTVDGVIFNEESSQYISVRRNRQQRYDLIYNHLKEQLTFYLEAHGIQSD